MATAVPRIASCGLSTFTHRSDSSIALQDVLHGQNRIVTHSLHCHHARISQQASEHCGPVLLQGTAGWERRCKHRPTEILELTTCRQRSSTAAYIRSHSRYCGPHVESSSPRGPICQHSGLNSQHRHRARWRFFALNRSPRHAEDLWQ